MAHATLAPSRVLHRPHHLDRRAALGLLLLCVATGGSLVFWSTSSSTTTVLVATHDLPAGATLSGSDLAVVHVRIDAAMAGAALPTDELSSVVGRQLSAPVYAHQLLVRAQLSRGLPFGRDQMVFTIPVTPDTAVGGRIQPGDVVEVLLTTGKGTSTPQSSVVLPRVSVYDVGHDSSLTTIDTAGSTVTNSPSPQGAISWLTLIVTERQALQLARAKWAGQLDVALRPGQ